MARSNQSNYERDMLDKAVFWHSKSGERQPNALALITANFARVRGHTQQERRLLKFAKYFYEISEKVEALHGVAKGEKVKGIVEEFLQKFILSSGREFDYQESEVKSIYEIAKDKQCDFKKLIYILKIIEFPTVQSEVGRKANLITADYLKILDALWPLIEILWKYESNHKKWILFFKKKKRWEKSRIAKFMHRRIIDKTVPVWYFEVLEPLEEYSNAVLERRKIFADGQKDRSDLLTRVGIKKFLRNLVRKSTTTLLTGGNDE